MSILFKQMDFREDLMTGGMADDMSDSNFDPKELEMGVKVELEHTDNPNIAREIARDHLKEIPDYYTRLKKMEAEAGVKSESLLFRNIEARTYIKNPGDAPKGVRVKRGKRGGYYYEEPSIPLNIHQHRDLQEEKP